MTNNIHIERMLSELEDSCYFFTQGIPNELIYAGLRLSTLSGKLTKVLFVILASAAIASPAFAQSGSQTGGAETEVVEELKAPTTKLFAIPEIGRWRFTAKSERSLTRAIEVPYIRLDVAEGLIGESNTLTLSNPAAADLFLDKPSASTREESRSSLSTLPKKIWSLYSDRQISTVGELEVLVAEPDGPNGVSGTEVLSRFPEGETEPINCFTEDKWFLGGDETAQANLRQSAILMCLFDSLSRLVRVQVSVEYEGTTPEHAEFAFLLTSEDFLRACSFTPEQCQRVPAVLVHDLPSLELFGKPRVRRDLSFWQKIKFDVVDLGSPEGLVRALAPDATGRSAALFRNVDVRSSADALDGSPHAAFATEVMVYRDGRSILSGALVVAPLQDSAAGGAFGAASLGPEHLAIFRGDVAASAVRLREALLPAHGSANAGSFAIPAWLYDRLKGRALLAMNPAEPASRFCIHHPSAGGRSALFWAAAYLQEAAGTEIWVAPLDGMAAQAVKNEALVQLFSQECDVSAGSETDFSFDGSFTSDRSTDFCGRPRAGASLRATGLNNLLAPAALELDLSASGKLAFLLTDSRTGEYLQIGETPISIWRNFLESEAGCRHLAAENLLGNWLSCDPFGSVGKLIQPAGALDGSVPVSADTLGRFNAYQLFYSAASSALSGSILSACVPDRAGWDNDPSCRFPMFLAASAVRTLDVFAKRNGSKPEDFWKPFAAVTHKPETRRRPSAPGSEDAKEELLFSPRISPFKAGCSDKQSRDLPDVAKDICRGLERYVSAAVTATGGGLDSASVSMTAISDVESYTAWLVSRWPSCDKKLTAAGLDQLSKNAKSDIVLADAIASEGMFGSSSTGAGGMTEDQRFLLNLRSGLPEHSVDRTWIPDTGAPGDLLFIYGTQLGLRELSAENKVFGKSAASLTDARRIGLFNDRLTRWRLGDPLLDEPLAEASYADPATGFRLRMGLVSKASEPGNAANN